MRITVCTFGKIVSKAWICMSKAHSRFVFFPRYYIMLILLSLTKKELHSKAKYINNKPFGICTMVLPVTKIMRKNVATINNSKTVYDAVKVLKAFNTSTVVVLDGSKICGVFSERDLVNRVVFPKKDPLKTPITAVMSTNPITITSDTTDVAVANLIKKHRVTKIPVTKNDKLVGIVAERDLLLYLAESIFSIEKE